MKHRIWRELSRSEPLFYVTSQSLHCVCFCQDPSLLTVYTMQHFHTRSSNASSQSKFGKKRGSYNCGRCGLPKKGHICTISTPATSTSATPSHSSLSVVASAPSSFSAAGCPPLHPRRALSFDDEESDGLDPLESTAVWPHGDDLDSSGLPGNVLWNVFKRLPPSGLLTAAKVSRGWRDMTKRLWKAAEELRLRVPASVQVGFVASMLQKCPGIVSLSIVMERSGSFIYFFNLSQIMKIEQYNLKYPFLYVCTELQDLLEPIRCDLINGKKKSVLNNTTP